MPKSSTNLPGKKKSTTEAGRKKSKIGKSKKSSTGRQKSSTGGTKPPASKPGPTPSGGAPSRDTDQKIITAGKNIGGHGVTEFDDLIKLLVELEGTKHGNIVPLKEEQLITLCTRTVTLLNNQPVLLKLEAPITIVGAVNGQYTKLLKLFTECGYPPGTNYVFLGNYVNGGKFSLECVTLLMAFKNKFPENFFMIVGKNEDPAVNKVYGFYKDCMDKSRGFKEPEKLYKAFNEVFRNLPIGAVIEQNVMCISSGLRAGTQKLEMYEWITKPLDFTKPLIKDTVYAMPEVNLDSDFAPDKGQFVLNFGLKAVKTFVERNNLSTILRTGVVKSGYQMMANRQLVTICSIPHYLDKYENASVVIEVRSKKNHEKTTLVVKPVMADIWNV